MATALADLDGAVDVVIANPPYIPLDAYESVAPEARDHDPTLALFSGADGLAAIRTVVSVATRLLRPAGLLCCEHADVQGNPRRPSPLPAVPSPPYGITAISLADLAYRSPALMTGRMAA